MDDYHVQESASFTHTRADGGKRVELTTKADLYNSYLYSERVREYRFKYNGEDDYRLSQASIDTQCGTELEDSLSRPINKCPANLNRIARIEYGFANNRHRNTDNEVRMSFVGERSNKTRVLTINHVERTTRARTAHALGLSILKKMDGVREILTENGLDGEMVGAGDYNLLSTDMSKATDNISQQWATLVCKGLLSDFSIYNMDWKDVARITCGPVKVKISETESMKTYGRIVPSFVTNRGTMMGTPFSWLYLSVLNSAAAAWAGFKYYRACGDDLIALC
eukprot:364338_1